MAEPILVMFFLWTFYICTKKSQILSGGTYINILAIFFPLETLYRYKKKNLSGGPISENEGIRLPCFFYIGSKSLSGGSYIGSKNKPCVWVYVTI